MRLFPTRTAIFFAPFRRKVKRFKKRCKEPLRKTRVLCTELFTEAFRCLF
jgi:hypothetical protein